MCALGATYYPFDPPYIALQRINSHESASIVNMEENVVCVLFLLISHKYNILTFSCHCGCYRAVCYDLKVDERTVSDTSTALKALEKQFLRWSNFMYSKYFKRHFNICLVSMEFKF
jgi:hypothetical protein